MTITRFRLLAFLFCFLISGFCFPTSAYADCTVPAGVAGDIIFNFDYVVPQYCNGATWQMMGKAVPQLKFIDQTGITMNTTITSNTITLVSYFSNVTVTCGAGCTAISINGAAFVAGPVTGVDGGDTIAIQQTSSGSGDVTTTATVTVGSTTSAVWSVTTDPCAGSPSSGTVCADGTVYVGLSPDGNVPMYTTPCDLGMSGTQFNCTGTRTTYMWGIYGVSADYTSYTTGESYTAGLVANYGTYDDGYTIGVPAAQACADQTFGGHSDWYLPARNELHLFWLAPPAEIGGLDVSGNRYWSSTESPYYASWYEHFSSDYRNYVSKFNEYFVRCVRK